MNLKQIVNRYVCPMASLPIFDSYVSNSSETARDIKAAMRVAGEEIARRAEWQELYKTNVIASGSTTYDLPSDFHRLINGNAIALEATPFTPIPYIRAADVWSFANASPSSQPYFSVKNGLIRFIPTLTADARLRYISKNWILSGDTEVDDITSDDDVAFFSAQLLGLGTLMRYKRAKGLAYQDIADEFEARLAIEIAADRGLT